MLEIHADNGDLIAIIVHSSFRPVGVNFVSREFEPLQLGISGYSAGDEVLPHTHNERRILIEQVQEIIYLEHGRASISFFDRDHQIIKTEIIETGDMAFFIDGGHGISFLEDTRLIEVKQGPYVSKKVDKRLIDTEKSLGGPDTK